MCRHRALKGRPEWAVQRARRIVTRPETMEGELSVVLLTEEGVWMEVVMHTVDRVGSDVRRCNGYNGLQKERAKAESQANNMRAARSRTDLPSTTAPSVPCLI